MRIYFLTILLSIFTLGFSGCAAHQGVQLSDVNFSGDAVRISKNESLGGSSRIVIYNALLTMDVDNPGKAVARIIPLGKKYGGYMVSSSLNRIVLRVKIALFEDAIKDIAGLGDLTRREIRGQDVTAQFKDMTIRLNNAVKTRDRLLELLKKAENVTAAMAVERELDRITERIERFKGQLKRMTHLANYATITVNVEEEVTPGLSLIHI